MSDNKIAVILANLGGPDSSEAVEPFLFNLFNDRHIIDIPSPLRWLLAKYISKKRAPIAREVYSHIGGRSPILENTQAQADKLQKYLDANCGESSFKVFVMMNYWHPFSAEVARAVNQFSPTSVILLPLYPQYSTTTTLSSYESLKGKLDAEMRIVCCYYSHALFVKAQAALVKSCYESVSEKKPLVLFSAHGLPVKIIKSGDPYQYQINETARLVVEAMGIEDLEWKVCYQSKVGRAEWLGPSTEHEISNAGKIGQHVVVVPIAFVSEHSETLVELDIEYKALTASGYTRVPTLGDNDTFIECLGQLILSPIPHKKTACPGFSRCWKRYCSVTQVCASQ